MFGYLRKRGISPQVIRAFLNAGLLYEDEKYHNCVFVGRDGAGVPRFASKWGTYDKDGASFKRDVLASDTDKMDAILQRLEGEMEFTTEDGYTGVLRLDHTSVQVTTDGYASKTTSLSATRTYPNLSDVNHS